MLRRLAWGAAAGLVAATAGAVAATPAERLLVLEAADLAGSPVAPFRLSAGRPVVFVFATIDCPISNRYAPELQRLHDEFGRKVAFWLVYPDRSLPRDALARHAGDFGYPFPAVHDVDHALVQATGATVMPEVAVFDRAWRLVYRGRIDDRVVEFGTVRPRPTRRDLHDVLLAIRSGRELPPRTTQAIGCYIPD